MGMDARRYLVCGWDKVLSAGEIVSENASHAVVTTTNRFFNSSFSFPSDTVDPIVTSGIAS